jgi:hypothetical protein
MPPTTAAKESKNGSIPTLKIRGGHGSALDEDSGSCQVWIQMLCRLRFWVAQRFQRCDKGLVKKGLSPPWGFPPSRDLPTA